MRKDNNRDLDPIVKEKMKKNLVHVAILSIIMIFAGLTSAYIVSMGDMFWIKYPLPLGFWVSSAFILLSSIFYIVAIKKSEKDNMPALRLFMILTFVAGVGFSIFQVVGYRQLIDLGANVSSSVMVVDGRYGDYFEVKYKGKYVEVEGNNYTIAGKPLTAAESKELKKFMFTFESTASEKGYSISSLPADFVLYYKNEPLSLQNGKLMKPNGEILEYIDMRRLKFLAWNIRDDRGDFFHRGNLGEDFHIFYKGKELSYKERSLYYNNKRLSAPLQNKINQSHDTATSYLYVITLLHLLHILGTLIYLIRMVKISFSKTLTFDNRLSIKTGAIFWHFLGLLWLYLLLFLLFIH
jgi:cytochrome c oxidase subunit 3